MTQRATEILNAALQLSEAERFDLYEKLEENLFPEFTTWREQIDGKYWFPTYSSADDVLHFNNSDVRMKQLLKFTDYKRTVTAAQK